MVAVQFLHILSVGLALLACGTPGSTGTVPVAITDTRPFGRGLITRALSKFIDGLRLEYNIQGLSFAVVQADGYYEAGGWGSSDEDHNFVSAETLFPIGSGSQAFLTSAFGILIDDYARGSNSTPLPAGVHELSFDTKVKDLLPREWKLWDEWASTKASMGDILGHLSGLPGHHFSYAATDSPEDITRRLRYLKPESELRSKWRFTDQMYYVAAHILSKYTSRSYATFVRERLLAPLNMTRTTFSTDEAMKTGKLSQAWIGPRRIPIWVTAESERLVAGSRGIISCAADMAKWAAMCLNSGMDPHTKRNVVPTQRFNETTTARSIELGLPILGSAFPTIVGYGLGWSRTSLFGHDMITTSGMYPGFSSLVSFLPAQGLAVVVLANADNRQLALAELTQQAVVSVLGGKVTISESEPEPVQAPPIGKIDSSLLDIYGGRYENPGYGEIVLCSPTSTSEYCSFVLRDFSHTSSSLSRDGKLTPGLYAAWPRFFSSHVQLLPFVDDERKFHARFVSLFPVGYGKNGTPFEWEADGGRYEVEFGVENGDVVGFGLSGVIEKEKVVHGVMALKLRADVWFSRNATVIGEQ